MLCLLSVKCWIFPKKQISVHHGYLAAKSMLKYPDKNRNIFHLYSFFLHCVALWTEIEGFIIIKKFLGWDLCPFRKIMDYDYSFFFLNAKELVRRRDY